MPSTRVPPHLRRSREARWLLTATTVLVIACVVIVVNAMRSDALQPAPPGPHVVRAEVPAPGPR